jgi:serine/threonine protein kinase
MGQTDSKKKIEEEFEIFKIEKDGNALLKSKKDSREYLMRIVTCSTQADMDRLKALLECRAQLKNHHILSLVEIKEKQQDYICSIHYKMYLVLEYSFKNLAQEIRERSTPIENNYFQESDIWSILYSCCTALNALYSNGATHESLTAEQIFINKDGFVKVTEPLLFGLEKNHL